MPYEQLEKLRNRLVDIYKTYKEPELDKDGKLINKKIKRNFANKLNENENDLDENDEGDNVGDDGAERRGSRKEEPRDTPRRASRDWRAFSQCSIFTQAPKTLAGSP